MDIQSSSSHSHLDPLLGDLDDIQVEQPEIKQSEHDRRLAEMIQEQPSAASSAKKRAYFWVKAKEGDEAFRAGKMDEDRKMNMDILRRQGYEVTVFKSNRAFFEHIQKDPSKVDLLVISDHGSPRQIGDLRVEEDNIVCTDSNLDELQQKSVFQTIGSVLKDDSILLFDACLAGNKTVENNIARIASRIIPQTRVYASQHETVYEPGFKFTVDEKEHVVIDTIEYGNYSSNVLDLAEPAIYRRGEELTKQEAVPLPAELVARRRRTCSGWKPWIIGAIVTVAAAAIGVGAWYWNKSK